MILWKFDVIPKFSSSADIVRTLSGGLISLFVIIFTLFVSYFQLINLFIESEVTSISTDNESLLDSRKFFVDFDIEICSSCTSLHLDLLEEYGYSKTDIIGNVTRIRLTEDGISIEKAMDRKYQNDLRNHNFTKNVTNSSYCGSCYGAKNKGSCCNTCHDVMVAFKKKGWSYFGAERWEQCVREGYLDFGKERCRLKGCLKIKKGTGSFHFGIGANSHELNKKHSHDLKSVSKDSSLNHTFHMFKIGELLPNFVSPLDGLNVKIPNDILIAAYHLNIVPSKYITKNKNIDSYRYSVTYAHKHLSNISKNEIPGIHFYYEFSPMKILTTTSKLSLKGFIMKMVGFIGGAFSFAAIIDSFIYFFLSSNEAENYI